MFCRPINQSGRHPNRSGPFNYAKHGSAINDLKIQLFGFGYFQAIIKALSNKERIFLDF
jgi:hypothetical protein